MSDFVQSPDYLDKMLLSVMGMRGLKIQIYSPTYLREHLAIMVRLSNCGFSLSLSIDDPNAIFNGPKVTAATLFVGKDYMCVPAGTLVTYSVSRDHVEQFSEVVENFLKVLCECVPDEIEDGEILCPDRSGEVCHYLQNGKASGSKKAA